MDKLEKVIKGLECCLTDSPSICEGCPYLETGCLENVRHFKHDILLDCLALLKAQEAVEVKIEQDTYPDETPKGFALYYCGNCGDDIADGQKFCANCGRPVKWE